MTDGTSSTGVVALLPSALAFAIGALFAGFATLTAWTNAYMGANPAVGSVSGGSTTFLVLMFVGGVMVMFLAAGRALGRLLDFD